MSLATLNIPQIKSDLLKKLQTEPQTGLFLSPLITRHGLTPDDVDKLILGLTEDEALRVEGQWKKGVDEISEVTFVRGPQE